MPNRKSGADLQCQQECGDREVSQFSSTQNDYHKVSDEVKPDWDLAGALEDLELLFQVGYRIARGDKWPEWKEGTEFKARGRRSSRRDSEP